MSTSTAADDVTSVITLALEVVDTCRGLPDAFSPGATAARALVATLQDYQIYSSSLQSVQVIMGSNDGSLTAHLAPCSAALKKMREIQQRQGQKGIKTRFKTNSDRDKFEREISALNEAVQRLREMVQALRQGAVTPYTQTEERYQPEHSASQAPQGSQASQASQASYVTQESQIWQASQASQNTPSPAQPISIVIVNQPQHSSQPRAPRAQPATSRPSYYSPSAKSRLPMCQGGSGCRAPLCHKSFDHPDAPACSMGRNCSVPGCLNWHPKSALCPNGSDCLWQTNGCSKAHPWPRQASPPPSRSEPRASQASVSELSEENSSRRPSANVNSPGLVSMVSSLSLESGSQGGAPTAYSASSPQPWCHLRFECPGGYNGQCPYRHPRRAACRDGSACTKGKLCTFDHSSDAAARPQVNASHGSSSPQQRGYRPRGQYSYGRGGGTRRAELP